jgi:hypothetical protein
MKNELNIIMFIKNSLCNGPIDSIISYYIYKSKALQPTGRIWELVSYLQAGCILHTWHPNRILFSKLTWENIETRHCHMEQENWHSEVYQKGTIEPSYPAKVWAACFLAPPYTTTPPHMVLKESSRRFICRLSRLSEAVKHLQLEHMIGWFVDVFPGNGQGFHHTKAPRFMSGVRKSGNLIGWCESVYTISTIIYILYTYLL